MTARVLGQRLVDEGIDSAGNFFVTSYEIVQSGGAGSMMAVPAASTNGTAIGTKPTGCTGVRLYCDSGDAITFTIQTAAPTTAPSETFTFSGPGGWDEGLLGDANVYVTAITGSPSFRWY